MNRLVYIFFLLIILLKSPINASGYPTPEEMNSFLKIVVKYTKDSKNFNQNKFNFLTRKIPDNLKKRRATLLMIATTAKKANYVKLFLPFSDVNAVSMQGISALHIAAGTKGNPILSILLEQSNIKVDTPDEDGIMPIHLASSKGFTSMVKELLEKGSNINARTHDNNTPLILALINQHYKTAKFLLTQFPQRINVNIANHHEVTALHLATRASRFEIIKLMLKITDIDPNTIDPKYGYAPLIKMILDGHTQLAITFVKHSNIRIQQRNGHSGETALMYSIKAKNLEVFKAILQHPITNINQANNIGNTPLTYTLLGGHTEMMKLLLEQETLDMLATNRKNQTIFHIAKMLKKEKLLEMLIQSCYVSFFQAIYQKDIEKQKKIANFLNLKEKINHPDPYNEATLLMFACYLEATYIVKVLLEEYSADPSISDSKYLNTPLMLVSSRGYKQIVKLLLKYLKKNEVNRVDHHGNTALMMACDPGHTRVVKQLLKCTDIDIYLPNKKNITPIVLVAAKGYIKILNMLLEKSDAEHLNQDLQGYNALVAGSMYGHIHVVKLLLNSNKIDWKEKGKKHYFYALSMAKKHEHAEIVQLLTPPTIAKKEAQHAVINSELTTEAPSQHRKVEQNDEKLLTTLVHSSNDAIVSAAQQSFPLQSKSTH